MKIFFCALAISLLLEGACFAFFPGMVRECMDLARKQPDNSLKKMGAGAIFAAVIILALLQIF